MKIYEKKSNETARDYAYRVIRENIISLDLEPGTYVSETKVASLLDLSRTPIREAFLELSKTSIVEIVPQKGTYISKIDYDLIEEARFFRLIVEKAITELACDKVNQKDIEALEKSIYMQKFYKEKNLPDDLLRADNEFHDIIYKIAEKEFIKKIIDDTTIHFDRVRRLSYSAVSPDSVIQEHKKILELLKSGKRDNIGLEVEKHLTRYELDKKYISEKYPEYIL